MRRQRLLLSAVALSLGLSALPALAASSSGDIKGGASGSPAARQLDCKDVKGTALANCLQQQHTASTPGRSADSASRESGRTPGHSEYSASRTGTPAGKTDSSPMGAPAAGGTPKGSNGSPKK